MYQTGPKFDPEYIFHNREKKKEYIAENKPNLNKRMLCLVQKLTHLPHDWIIEREGYL